MQPGHFCKLPLNKGGSVNQLVISLIALLIPGLIAALVYDSITQHEKWNNFTFSVAAILFG
ncbi:MAG: hypothetical protein DU429_07740 [Candidatus Tokpelaia sp.]|nr:MAG: hypothetical protein DU429_07740 [Candidatus Tokpelaia sp.]KAA6206300.1 MAG: hypothetical protein DU430_01925 [Candidatus Tokpelaia sp.]